MQTVYFIHYQKDFCSKCRIFRKETGTLPLRSTRSIRLWWICRPVSHQQKQPGWTSSQQKSLVPGQATTKKNSWNQSQIYHNMNSKRSKLAGIVLWEIWEKALCTLDTKVDMVLQVLDGEKQMTSENLRRARSLQMIDVQIMSLLLLLHIFVYVVGRLKNASQCMSRAPDPSLHHAR